MCINIKIVKRICFWKGGLPANTPVRKHQWSVGCWILHLTAAHFFSVIFQMAKWRQVKCWGHKGGITSHDISPAWTEPPLCLSSPPTLGRTLCSPYKRPNPLINKWVNKLKKKPTKLYGISGFLRMFSLLQQGHQVGTPPISLWNVVRADMNPRCSQ